MAAVEQPRSGSRTEASVTSLWRNVFVTARATWVAQHATDLALDPAERHPQVEPGTLSAPTTTPSRTSGSPIATMAR